ncbi:MAG: SRPBCC domain-containing protein [Chlorobium sp.]
MKIIRSEITINASSEEVWSVLAAFHLYPEWNPFIRAVRGNLLAGKQLWFKARLDGLPAILFRATIRQFVPPVKLGWYAIFLKGIFEAYHYFEIEDFGSGKSRFINIEEFSGLLSGVVFFLLESRFKKSYQMMDEALKERVEVYVQ